MATLLVQLATVAGMAAALYLVAPWWGAGNLVQERRTAMIAGVGIVSAANLLLPRWTPWDDAIVWVAVIVAVIDAYEHLVPNRWVLCLLVLASWRLIGHGTWVPTVALAVAVFLALAGFHAATAGLGWGDVKYAAAGSLALGYPAALWALTIGLLAAGLAAALLLAGKRRRRRDSIALAPFLSLGLASALGYLAAVPLR